MPAKAYLLGDKAYIGVPGTLPPVKRNDRAYDTATRKKYNRAHGWYRARIEHAIARLKVWAVLAGRWRAKEKENLGRLARFVAACRVVYCSYRLPYLPYKP